MSENTDHFNRGGAIAFVFTMVFVFAFFIYIALIHPGVDLGEKVADPSQTSEADQFNIDKVAEPWLADAKVAGYGAKVYAQNCAICHGDKGMGDGAGGAGLNPKPRNLVEGKWTQGGGEIAHFKVLQNGIAGTGMASFSHLKAADRWALVQFIQSITNNKGKNSEADVAAFAKTAK